MSRRDMSPGAIERRRLMVVRMTKAGASGAEIAREVGLTRARVYRIRRLEGLAKPSRPVTPEQEARMATLAADGASVAEIARTVGVSWPSVAKRHPSAVWSMQQAAEWGAWARRQHA